MGNATIHDPSSLFQIPKLQIQLLLDFESSNLIPVLRIRTISHLQKRKEGFLCKKKEKDKTSIKIPLKNYLAQGMDVLAFSLAFSLSLFLPVFSQLLPQIVLFPY
jgi:hypothetical protein